MNTKLDKKDYFIHPHNATAANERCVELALALRWMLENDGNFVEVGAVMPWYPGVLDAIGLGTGQDCIDPNDKKGNVVVNSKGETEHDDKGEPIKVGIMDVSLKGENVLAISTMEHIGVENNGETLVEPKAAQEALQKILKESKSCFITIPLGYHAKLDEWIYANLKTFKHFAYHKTQHRTPDAINDAGVNVKGSIDPAWEYMETLERTDYKFRDPFPLGNTIIFITGKKRKSKAKAKGK